jgi:hypothetical protein
MSCRDSQNGLSLAILAAFVVAIRPATLPATARSGKIDRHQPPGIDQLSQAGEDPHPKDFRALRIESDAFHGDWNYVIRPRAKEQ